MSAMSAGFDQERLRLYASRPGTVGRGPQMQEAGRVCGVARCDTILSRYNRTELCWQHEPRHEFLSAVRGRRPAEVEIVDLLPVAQAS